MDRQRVEQILNRFSGKPIIVVGDVMLDEFIWGRVARISPEAPVPVVEVSRETYRVGGAGNVAANIASLDGKAVLIGVVGIDSPADRLVTAMNEARIDAGGLFRTNRPTTVKTRIIAHNQQVVRADREARTPLSEATTLRLAGLFLEYLPTAVAVVISDYDKGVVNRDLLSVILPEARKAGVPVLLDPKVHHADYYRPITLITPNQREAESLTGMPIDNQDTLEGAGRRLLQKFGCEHAVITRGEEGMSFFTKTSSGADARHLPTFAREVFDVTGAGDTVIATLALARAGGAAMEESAILANHAAGIVVGKVGTATVSRTELLADFTARNAHSAG